MATYYVRTDGSNANTGLGSTAALAWQTITYALANMTLTSGTNYLYIAPGVYRESPTVTVTPSSTQTLVIQGDTTSSIFTGISAGPVRVTNYTNDNTNPASGTVLTCAKTYTTFRNLSFVMYGNAIFTNSEYINIDKCIFESIAGSGDGLKMTANGTTSINGTITNSVFIGRFCLNICGPSTGTAFNFNVAISDCLFIGNRTILVDVSNSQFSNTVGNGLNIYNCTFYGVEGIGLFTSNATHPSTIRNCNFIGNTGSSSVGITSQGTNRQTEDFNRFSCTTARTNVTGGTNSTVGITGVDWSMSYINTLVPVAIFAPIASSPLISGGTPTGAPTTDIYGNAWTSNTDIGAFARTSLASSSFYYPTERNASTITIAPGSTSQSIELYLGATGLTASTAGLSAYYNRTRSADVQIPLVARTIGQAWTSGGFAEVNASTMPGVYRLDLPDAAVAAGADDVTVVVRGASGTNGAVMTIKLSSGGLTAAQTASAILDAVGASYVTAGSIGYAIQNSNVASISGSTAAADELEGALLHNGTDYISAQLIAGGGGGAGDVGGNIINLNEDPEVIVQTSAWVGDWHTYVLRLVDSNGTPYDITNDTLAVTFTNVATGSAYAFGGGSATITKQMNGQGILSILNPAAYPSAAVIRLTVSATIGSDVRRFGPLEIEVLAP